MHLSPHPDSCLRKRSGPIYRLPTAGVCRVALRSVCPLAPRRWNRSVHLTGPRSVKLTPSSVVASRGVTMSWLAAGSLKINRRTTLLRYGQRGSSRAISIDLLSVNKEWSWETTPGASAMIPSGFSRPTVRCGTSKLAGAGLSGAPACGVIVNTSASHAKDRSRL